MNKIEKIVISYRH